MNATHTKQLYAVSNSGFNWNVDNEDDDYYETSEEEGALAYDEQERLQVYEERANEHFPDEDNAGVVRTLRKAILRRERRERESEVFIPRAPLGWATSEWEEQVQELRLQEGYPHHEEPRGVKELEHAIWLEGKLDEYRGAERMADLHVPRPPHQWNDSYAEWVRYVSKVYQHKDYPYEVEKMLAPTISFDDFGERIWEHGKRLEIDEPTNGSKEELNPGPSNQFERRYMEHLAVSESEDTGYESPEPWVAEDWEKRIDDLTTDFEATNADIDRLEECLAEDRLTDEVKGKELEQLNAAEIDHPWHVYSGWKTCYTKSCPFHYEDKMRNNHIPIGKAPIYYDRRVMKEIIRRRRSTGQLQSKN